MPAAAELKPSAAERDADGPLMVFSAMAACLFAALSALYVIAAHAENGPLAAFGIKVNCAVSLVGFLFTYFAVPTLREVRSLGVSTRVGSKVLLRKELNSGLCAFAIHCRCLPPYLIACLCCHVIFACDVVKKFIAANLFGIDLNKSTTRRNKDGSLYRDPATNRIEGIKVPEVRTLSVAE